VTARSSALALALLTAAGCEAAADSPPVGPRRPASKEAAPPLDVVEEKRPVRGVIEEDPADCATAHAKIRLRTSAVAAEVGIETITVTARPIARAIEVTGVTALDERRLARLSARVGGLVREAGPIEGAEVEEGEVLAVLESLELGEAKAALRRAAAIFALRAKSLSIERELAEGKVSTRREALEVEAAFEEARIERERARERLRLLGLAPEALSAIESGADADPLVAIRAPFAGTVVRRNAGAGEVVEAGRVLYELADLSRILLRVDLAEKDYAVLDAGEAKVVFRLDARPGERFRGKLVAGGAEVDRETRVIRATAELQNTRTPGGRPRLLPGMFGHAEIRAGDREEAIVIPGDAVQWEGCHHVVFVETRPGLYATRPVELGLEIGTWREIRAGLAAGERVVTTGSYLLKTEILKGSIGAGCCE
jgi:cobalt-zinc-cadmium efflux system membrane fusion protein